MLAGGDAADAVHRVGKWVDTAVVKLGKRGSITFTDSIAEAVTDAGFIQESTPEDEALKRRILREIDEAAPVDTPIGSSTSGLLPSKLQADMAQPERFMAAHPFNPVYLLPLVELCGGDQTAREFIDQGRRPARWGGPALGADGVVPDLPHRRGRGRHAALHGTVWSGTQVAVDQADGRAGTHRCLSGQTRRAVR